MASPRILLTAEDTALFQGDGASVFLLDGESPFNFGDDGVGGPKAKKKKIIRLYDADRETTAQFLKEQLKLRQGLPEPLKEIQEKQRKRVIVAQGKREAKMRKEYEEAEAQKEEVLRMNNQILMQLIAIAHDS